MDAYDGSRVRWYNDGYVPPRRAHRAALATSHWTEGGAVILAIIGTINVLLAGLSTQGNEGAGILAIQIGVALLALAGLLKIISMAAWRYVPATERPVPYGGL